MPPNVAKLLSLSPMYKAAIIGAGASGCFCAVEMKRRHPDWDIVVLESAPAPLQKLATAFSLFLVSFLELFLFFFHLFNERNFSYVLSCCKLFNSFLCYFKPFSRVLVTNIISKTIILQVLKIFDYFIQD